MSPRSYYKYDVGDKHMYIQEKQNSSTSIKHKVDYMLI